MNISVDSKDNIQIDEQDFIVPVIAEKMLVNKEKVETGRVIVSKKVEEITESVTVPLFQEEYSIEHIPMDKLIDELPSVRQESNVMIVPVIKEVMIKRIMLVEEIRITKQVTETSEPLQIPLRKEVVTVTRSGTQQ